MMPSGRSMPLLDVRQELEWIAGGRIDVAAEHGGQRLGPAAVADHVQLHPARALEQGDRQIVGRAGRADAERAGRLARVQLR